MELRAVDLTRTALHRVSRAIPAAACPGAPCRRGAERLGLAAPSRTSGARRQGGSSRSGSLRLRAANQSQPLVDFVLVPWDVEHETWDEEAESRMQSLVDKFVAGDKDGNGVIDREELREMLEKVGNGEDEVPMHWLTDEDISDVMSIYDSKGNGVIDFDGFVRMSQDKIFLTGKLSEYKAAFRAVDAGGNGTIGATELYQLFDRLGHPISYEKLVQVMERYDVDQSGAIDFGEFLRMFRSELLDLQEIMEYLKKRSAAKAAKEAAAAAAADAPAAEAAPAPAAAPASPASTAAPPKLLPGGVNLFFSEEQFDAILAANPGKLIVLMASVTWCRPCKGFQTKYEAAAEHYSDAIFLKFYGNSNESTKQLFKDRLKARTTPSFFFFRDGKVVESCTGANDKRVETHLRKAYGAGGSPPPALWSMDQA